MSGSSIATGKNEQLRFKFVLSEAFDRSLEFGEVE